MPTTQIINYQQDPGQQQLENFGKDIAETIQKAQSLKLTGQYYKILAKNAQTDQDKFKFERLAKLNSDILPQIANTKDPATKSMLIKGVVQSGMYDGDANTFYHDIADSHEVIQDNHKNVTGNVASQLDAMKPEPGQSYATEGQLRGAQVYNQNAEGQSRGITAANQLAMANIMRQQTGQPMLPDSMLGGDQGQQPQQATQSPVTESQVNQIQQPTAGTPTRMMFSGISGGQPQFTVPSAKQAESYASSQGTELGKRDIAQQKFNQDFESFKYLNDQIPRGEGGVLNRLATGARLVQSGISQEGVGKAVAGYSGAAARMAGTIARQTDVGNLSEFEQQRAAKLVPSLFDSKDVADLKMAFLEDINRPLGTQSPENLRKLISSYEDKVAAVNNPNTPKAQAINRVTGQIKSNASDGYTTHKSGLKYKIIQ